MVLKKVIPGERTTSKSNNPIIRFDQRGLITLNRESCLLIGLQGGDCVVVYQDDEHPTDWFIGKATEGFRLRAIRPSGCGFNCKGMVTMVKELLSWDHTASIACRISNNAITNPDHGEVYPILLSSAL
ncbi:hypothetical protein SAMN05444266_101642 [Chitinophaga jiangningensis]|uniref:Uncharacterized protein n=1 Tax=Chitinophaga jiangningensis TaxID=1419482 RepID=A0A1M6WIY7_9BACT|nr:hypothetical protein SAMN05444266_101642 [Chitinophaga jiangningensis]